LPIGSKGPLADTDLLTAVQDALGKMGFQPQDEAERRAFVRAALKEGEEFRGGDTLRRHAEARLQRSSAVEMALAKLAQLNRQPDPGTRVRLVIARLFEQRFGADARAEYVRALATGEAP